MLSQAAHGCQKLLQPLLMIRCAEGPHAGPPAVPAEAPGTGANANTYYVASQLGGPFTKLPDTMPEQALTISFSCTPPLRDGFVLRALS